MITRRRLLSLLLSPLSLLAAGREPPQPSMPTAEEIARAILDTPIDYYPSLEEIADIAYLENRLGSQFQAVVSEDRLEKYT
jgi:hypothetical protein